MEIWQWEKDEELTKGSENKWLAKECSATH